MKKNSFDIDNRAEWKMRKIIHENVVTHNQLDNLFEYAGNDHTASQTKKIKNSLRSVINNFNYSFNYN